MSSNYWQIKKQSEQFKHGNTTHTKIKSYVTEWERRCYSSGIPDSVDNGLMASGRVPSYRAIATAILNNDLTLKSLGFSGKESGYYFQIKREEKRKLSNQLELL